MTGASEGGGRGVTLGHEVIGLEHALDVCAVGYHARRHVAW